MHRRPHLRGVGAQGFEGRSSRFYDVLARTVLRRVYRRLADDVARTAPADARVLDVGTGPGVLLAELGRIRPDLQLTGVDLSADMVAAARRNLAPLGERAEACVGDAVALPFPDASFEVVVSTLSMHHWAEPKAAAPEVARVLRAAGELRVYDVRSAPFDTFLDACREVGAFAATSSGPSRVATGIPFLSLSRLVLARPAAAG